jgi:hypothetical protein
MMEADIVAELVKEVASGEHGREWASFAFKIASLGS